MNVKCKKCRVLLLNYDCLIDIHNEPMSEGTSSFCQFTSYDTSIQEKNTLLYIDYEKAPTWVLTIIDDSSWTAGKLTCEKCSSKVGSFNFLNLKRCPCCNILSPCIWLVKSKVDVETSSEIKKLAQLARSTPSVSNKFETKQRNVSTKQVVVKQRHKSDTASGSVDDCDQIEELKPDFVCESDLVSLKKEKQNKLLKLQRHKESLLICSDKTFTSQNTCTICMDIFFRPVRCNPCKHKFCESCVKQWHHYSKGYWCPICRQLILSTCYLQKLDSKLSMLLPLMYEEKHQSRKKYQKYKLPRMTKHEYQEAQALQYSEANDHAQNARNEGLWELRAGRFFRRFEYGYIWLNIIVLVVCVLVSTIHFISSYF